LLLTSEARRAPEARLFSIASQFHDSWGRTMLGTILIVLLVLALFGAFPRWGYSRGWGYGPSGLVGVLLIIVLVLALTGRM
jgi:fatty acid desaturase